MNILRKLTVRHLLQNKKRTIITVIGIVLSVAMVTAVSGMVVSTQDLLYRDSVARSGLWHVRYSGLTDEVIELVAMEPVFSGYEVIPTEEGPVLSLLFGRLHKGIFEESEEVCFKYGIEQDNVRYHNDLLVAKGIVPGAYYRALYSFAGILMVLIGLGSVLVISNAFAISSDQRSVQFGLLKSTGATRKQIRGMVLYEGLVLTAIAIPIGIVAGLFTQWVALTIANSILTPMRTVTLEVMFRVIVSPLALGVSAVAAVITVLVAAWFPARKAARVSAVEAIRQTQTIKLSPRAVKTSPFTKKLFGFEGDLAARALKRNRGKYRATVLALVVSMVLFIGVSSFGSILIKATSMVYEDSGSNVYLTMRGGTLEEYRENLQLLGQFGEVEIHQSWDVANDWIELPENALTKSYRNNFEGMPVLRLVCIGDKDFQALCNDLGLSVSELEDTGNPSGILINTSGTYIDKGTRINFMPYNVKAGDTFPIDVNEKDFTLRIAAVTDVIPTGIYMSFSANSFQVVVPESTGFALVDPDRDPFLRVPVMAPDADAFEAYAIEVLEGRFPEHSYSVINYEQQAASSRNISMLVMIFVYGFIAMLSLIGVTSVIATVSTSIALRRREFAMLRSVGMTEKAVEKMLGYESLLYGLKALGIGIPLGLWVSWLLYGAMTSVMEFAFIWPVGSVAICVVAVMLLTFGTMQFAHRKQRHMGIMEALRSDIL